MTIALGHTITGLWYKITPGKVMLCMADLGWAKASYGSLGTFNLGGTYFVQPPPPGAFQATHLLETLHRYPIESLCAPPTIYRGLVTHSSLKFIKEHPFNKLNHVVGAGEPLNPSVINEWRAATGLTIRDGWGQSESVIMVGNWDGVKVREGSMGKVAPFFEVGIIGPDGEELKRGEEGELAVRCDQGAGTVYIFKGYVKNGKIDKRQKTHGGKTWYCTGDRGILDDDDYFHFVGRDDDVITSSGYRIGPFEVESALKVSPQISLRFQNFENSALSSFLRSKLTLLDRLPPPDSSCGARVCCRRYPGSRARRSRQSFRYPFRRLQRTCDWREG